MTSPLVRAWLAARLPAWADHAYACWRGLLHALTCRSCKAGRTEPCPREWDPCEIDPLYTDLPGLAARDPQGGQAGESHYHTLLPCPVCKVSVGKDCITRFGNVTGPHRARREAAAAQTAAEVQS